MQKSLVPVLFGRPILANHAAPSDAVCPAHPLRQAVSACAVCRRPVCDLCVGQIDRVDFCPAHFTVEEERIRAQSYGLPPLPVPVTVAELLLGVWAVIGALSPWFEWYRTVVLSPGGEGFRAVTPETGWSAGGVAALASVALLASGITLGAMVGLRIVRSRWIAQAAVAQAALGLGGSTLALLAIRVLTRYRSLSTGLYLAITSAALVLYLSRRLVKATQTESPRR
jgi:hypothetical protein